jgi:hypothetical protein
MKYNNRVNIDTAMQIKVTMQIYNTNTAEPINKETGDNMYSDVNNLYKTLQDWFCRIDTITYPYSKGVYSTPSISRVPIAFTNPETTQTERAYQFTYNFKYNINKEI